MTITPTRPLVALLAAAASAGCAANAAATPPHYRTCDPRGAHTLGRDREVRVYSLAGMRSREGVYACLRRNAATVVLSRSARIFRGEPVVEHITLAGTMVAYTSSTRGVDTGSTDIEVLDVARPETRSGNAWDSSREGASTSGSSGPGRPPTGPPRDGPPRAPTRLSPPRGASPTRPTSCRDTTRLDEQAEWPGAEHALFHSDRPATSAPGPAW